MPENLHNVGLKEKIITNPRFSIAHYAGVLPGSKCLHGTTYVHTYSSIKNKTFLPMDPQKQRFNIQRFA